MKMDVFWVVVPCSLVSEVLAASIIIITSETSVNFYQTTRRYNPEDSHLHLSRSFGVEIGPIQMDSLTLCKKHIKSSFVLYSS
jgi:hypothetical protein